MEQIIQKFNFWDQAAIFSLKTLEIMLNQRQHVEEEVLMKWIFLQFRILTPASSFFDNF